MLDVGAVAARSGPPVPPAEEAERLVARDRGPGEGHRPADLRRHLLGRGRRRGARRGRRRDQRHQRRRRPRLFELAAETGCGLVLMHIEGPPREDREIPRFDDPVEHLKGWFSERIEAATAAGVDPEQIVIDPGIDFDLGVADGLEVLRRLGELRELGPPALRLALAQGPARRGARRVVGGAAAAHRARVGDRRRDRARGRERAPPSSACTTRARCRRCGSRERSVASGDRDPGGAWETAIGARPQGRPAGRRELRAGDDGEATRAARRPDPELAEALARGGIESLYSHQAEAFESAREARPDPDQRHRAAASRSPSTSRSWTGSRTTPSARAFYLYPTKALAQDQARKLGELRPPGPARGDLRRRHPARGAALDPPALEPGPHQPRHAQRRGAPPPQALGRLPRQPRLGRRRRGPHLPRRLRLPRRQRTPAPAARRAHLRRRPALCHGLGDDRQPRRAGRAADRAPSSRCSTTTARRAPGARSRCGTRR